MVGVKAVFITNFWGEINFVHGYAVEFFYILESVICGPKKAQKTSKKLESKEKMRSATNLSTNRTAWKLEGIAIKMVFAQANVPGTRSPHPEFSGFLIQFFVIFLPSCRGPVRQRETKHYGVNGGRQNFIFPVQLTTDHEQD